VNNGFGGGWGGGYRGWGGGGWGGGYGGWGGGGWASPYYGNWYRGGWGNSSAFWTGFGTGALTSFGLGSMYGSGVGGWYGYSYPGYGVAMPMAYSYFPTWGLSTYSDWGLGSIASSALYSGYSNPYYATAVAAQPAQTTVVYDYSQPINVTAAPPDASVTESTEQVFSAARDSFMAGDYQRALDLSDQVLKQTPNAAVVHEFRALCLFALKRYDDAASVAYAVLTAGPGWNWSTMVGLYPGVDAYTDQLRALEAYARANPNSTSARFLLGYQYMVQGNQEAAAAQFENVVKLQPNETLSASFAKALRKAIEPAPVVAAAASQPATGAAPNTNAAAPPQAGQTGAEAPPAEAPEQQAPPPPPAQMAGTWKAQPAPDVSITLTLQPDGQFAWDVDSKGQKQSLSGNAGFKDNELALFQQDGPPLIGKVTQSDANKFVFAPTGSGDKAPGLTFTK
jgi:tetratricopeptide (TPR) repeat protein